MSSSVHANNKTKDIVILGKGQTEAEAEYSINYSRSRRKFCISQHYNGSNSFLFINVTKMHQFKAEDSEINKYPSCLGNISKDFLVNYMKKTG